MDCKIYVGDLGSDASKQDLEDAFSYYGKLRNVWVARNPPGFAFVEYEYGRDAEDAVRALDGRTLCGSRVRVELARGHSRSRQRGPPPRRGGGGGGGRPFHADDRCYDCGERGHYARDCNNSSRRPRKSRSRTRSPRRRSYSRSRSRSHNRSLSRSPKRNSSRGRSRSESRGRSTPRDNKRSVSPRPNGDGRDRED